MAWSSDTLTTYLSSEFEKQESSQWKASDGFGENHHTLEIFGDHTMPTVLSVPRNLTFYNGLDFQLLPICQVVYKATTKWSNMWGRTWGKDGQSASLNVLFTVSLSQYWHVNTGAFHQYSKTIVHQDMLRFEYILLFVHCSLLFCRRRCGSHSDDRMDAHGTNHDLFASSFFQGTLLE